MEYFHDHFGTLSNILIYLNLGGKMIKKIWPTLILLLTLILYYWIILPFIYKFHE